MSKNDFIVCRKKAKPQQGGSETEGLPPWCGSPKPPDKENPKKREEKRGEGKGERKIL